MFGTLTDISERKRLADTSFEREYRRAVAVTAPTVDPVASPATMGEFE